MTQSLTFDDVAYPFATGLYSLARLSEDPRLSRSQRGRVLEAMSSDIRKLCDIAVPSLIPYEISFMAWGLALNNGVDLRTESWHGQSRFDPGRRSFHVEHVVPVNVLRTSCVAAPDIDAIVEVLRGIRIAWLLKGEDALLTEAGFRSRRADPRAAYDSVHISFVDPAEMDRQWETHEF